MNWLDEVVEYVNQKGQGLGASVYDYLNDPESAEELLKYLPAGAMGYTSMEDAARKVFPHSRLNPEAGNQTYVEERGMDKAAKGMEGRFPSQRIGATDTGTRYVEPPPPQPDYSTEAQNKAKAGRWTNPSQSNPLPSQDPRIIRKVGGDFSVGGRGIPNAMRGLGGAGGLGAAMANPVLGALIAANAVAWSPEMQEQFEKGGIKLANLMGAGNMPMPEKEWRNTEEAKGLGYGKSESEIKASNEAQELSDISRKNQEVMKSGRDLLDNRGNTSEEIEKAWGKPNTETGKMGGGISGLGDTVSNKNMFTREADEKKTTPEEDRVAKAEEMMSRAKAAAVRVLGYNPDDIDPQREALGNTYRHLQGSYYTPQQYNAVYNYYYKDAMDKKKSGATAVQHVMDRITQHVGTTQANEENRKATLEQRRIQHEEKMAERKEKDEKKRLEGKKENVTAINKSLDMAFARYAQPDETTGVVDPNKVFYALPSEMQDTYSETKAKAERLMKSNNLTPEEAVRQAIGGAKLPSKRVRDLKQYFARAKDESDLQKMKKAAMAKEYGYTQEEVDEASGVQAGGQQAQSKYVIKSVK